MMKPINIKSVIHYYEGFGTYCVKIAGGNFSGQRVSEYSGFEKLCELAEFIQEAGEDLAGELVSHFGGDTKEACEAFTENYQGEFNDLGHYAESFAEELSFFGAILPAYQSNTAIREC
jgi:antirestriction protein